MNEFVKIGDAYIRASSVVAVRPSDTMKGFTLIYAGGQSIRVTGDVEVVRGVISAKLAELAEADR